MGEPESKFSYFINRKELITVVSFNGIMDETNAFVKVLQSCLDEIQNAPPKHLILNFSNLVDIEKGVIRTFTQFQSSVRERAANLYLCGIKHDLSKILETNGIVREQEVHRDLISTLQKIISGKGAP